MNGLKVEKVHEMMYLEIIIIVIIILDIVFIHIYFLFIVSNKRKFNGLIKL